MVTTSYDTKVDLVDHEVDAAFPRVGAEEGISLHTGAWGPRTWFGYTSGGAASEVAAAGLPLVDFVMASEPAREIIREHEFTEVGFTGVSAGFGGADRAPSAIEDISILQNKPGVD